MTDNDDTGEKIFALNQEIAKLKNQITYLQEELAAAEDTIDTLVYMINTLENV